MCILGRCLRIAAGIAGLAVWLQGEPVAAYAPSYYECSLGRRLDVQKISERPGSEALLPAEKLARGIYELKTSEAVAEALLAKKDVLMADAEAMVNRSAPKGAAFFSFDEPAAERAETSVAAIETTFCILALAEYVLGGAKELKPFLKVTPAAVESLQEIGRAAHYWMEQSSSKASSTTDSLEKARLRGLGQALHAHATAVAIELARYLPGPRDRARAQVASLARKLEVAVWNNDEHHVSRDIGEIADRLRELGDIASEDPALRSLDSVIRVAYGHDGAHKIAERTKEKHDFKIASPNMLYPTLFSYFGETIQQGWLGQSQAVAALLSFVQPSVPQGSSAAVLFPALDVSLRRPPLSFGPPTDPQEVCREHRNHKGATRGLLIGAQPSADHAAGVRNDTALIKRTMVARGVSDQIELSGQLEPEKLVATLRDLVAETRCGDIVLVHLSAFSISGADGDEVEENSRKPRQPNLLKGLPEGWATFIVLETWQSGREREVFNKALLRGVDISEFVTAIRNRGASIALFIDTSGAAGLGIQHFQELAAERRRWRSRPHLIDAKPAAAQPPGWLTPVASNAGDYAVFYGADRDFLAQETDLPDPLGGKRQPFGLFSYAVAKALQTIQEPTATTLATAITSEYQSQREAILKTSATAKNLPIVLPVFEGSNPDMRLLQPGRAKSAEELDIEIISPPRAHGSNKLELRGSTLLLVGRIGRPKEVLGLTINGIPTPIDSLGQFSTDEMTLKPGQDTVEALALYSDLRWRTRTLGVTYEGDLERLAASGRRYALVIGIQNYDHIKPPLTTPHNDAREVARVLQEHYGFTLEIGTGSGKPPQKLLLLDATRPEIESALSALRRNLAEQDTLLVYYAGHGQFIGQSKDAYWIPKDGQLDEPLSWIAASVLNSQLKQINARSVLVVSDSCFSGAMRGGVADFTVLDADRRRALLRAGTRKSRMFITSGGVEPVLDEGCSPHSIFACAFLKGLQGMQQSIFASRELYSTYILPGVAGREVQQPEHGPLRDSGTDGGEFIFARTQALQLGQAVEAKTPKASQ